MADVFNIEANVTYPNAVRNAQAAANAAQKAFSNINGGGVNGLVEPLGHIARNATQFNKSLEASTARVLAFGATVGIVYGVQRAFRAMVTDAINVEQSLVRIGSILKTSGEDFKRFSAGVFTAARNTGQSFEDAAAAAEVLARQGLGTEETLKRLNSALILSRLSGISAKEATQELTATLNSFQKQVLSSGDVVNKFSAIAQNFSVSENDLSTAIQRVGSSAEDAGVDFNHLTALITSLKQTTQRDGAVIGDALKSIFTRLQRTDTITELEALGVAMKNVDGTARSATDVLKNLAAVYPTLSTNQKAYVTEISAGLFQVNQFKAALNDLNKEYSIYNRALDASSNATDEAIKRNERLNQTFAAQINSVKLAGLQIGAGFGTTALKKPLAGVTNFAKQITGQDENGNIDGNAIGVKIGTGIAAGIGNVLSGPGGLAITAILLKLSQKTASYALDAAKTLLPTKEIEEQRLKIVSEINNLLQKEGTNYAALTAGAKTQAEAEEIILNIVKQRVALQTLQHDQVYGAAVSLSNAGVVAGESGGLGFRGGRPSFEQTSFVPHLADPLREAYDREKASGVPESSIYLDRDSRLKSSDNPLGLLVANRIDEPLGGWQGVNRALGAGKRIGKNIPNYAAGMEGEDYFRKYQGEEPSPYQKSKDIYGKVYSPGDLPTSQEYKDDEIAAQQAKIVNALQQYREGIEKGTKLGKIEAGEALDSIGVYGAVRKKLIASISDQINATKAQAKEANLAAKQAAAANKATQAEQARYNSVVQRALSTPANYGDEYSSFGQQEDEYNQIYNQAYPKEITIRGLPTSRKGPFLPPGGVPLTNAGIDFFNGLNSAYTPPTEEQRNAFLTDLEKEFRRTHPGSNPLDKRVNQAVAAQKDAELSSSIRVSIAQGKSLTAEQQDFIGRQGDIYALSHPAFQEPIYDKKGNVKGTRQLTQSEIFENPGAATLYDQLKDSYAQEQIGAARGSNVRSVIGEHFSQNQGSLFGSTAKDLKAIETKLGRKLSSSEKELIFNPSAANARNNRRSAINSTAFNASILASFGAGAVESFAGPGYTTSAVQGGATALSAAALLSQAGAPLGPIGIGAGALAGAGIGAASYAADQPKRDLEELTKKFEDLNASVQKNIQSTSNYTQTQEKLNDLISSGEAKQSDIEALNVQLGEFFNQLTDNKLKNDIIDAGGDIEKLGKALGEFSKTSSQVVSKQSVSYFTQKALTDSSGGLFTGGKQITNENLSSISGAIANSLKPGDLAKLQGLYSAADRSSGGAKSIYNQLGQGGENEKIFALLADKDYSAAFQVLRESIEKLGQSVKLSAEDISNNKLAVSLVSYNKLFDELSETIQGEQERLTQVKSSQRDIALSRVKAGAEIGLLGVSEKGIIGAQSQVSKAEILKERDNAQDQLVAALGHELLTFADKFQEGSASKLNIQRALTGNPAQGLAPERPDLLLARLLDKSNPVINSGDIKGAGENIGTTVATLQAGFGVKLGKLQEYDAKIEELNIQTSAQLQILRQKNLSVAFGGADIASKNIDLNGVAAGTRAGFFRQLGEGIINNDYKVPGYSFQQPAGYNRTQYRNTAVQAKVQGFRQTEAQSLLSTIGFLGPELGAALSSDPNSLELVKNAKLSEDKQKLDQLTKAQISSLFSTSFSLGSKRGGLDYAGVGGNIYRALGQSVNRTGGKYDYDDLTRIADQFGSQLPSDNPTISRLRGILRTGQNISGQLGDTASAQAKALLKTDAFNDPAIGALIKGFEGEQIATNTAKTADLLQELLDVQDKSGAVVRASKNEADIRQKINGLNQDIAAQNLSKENLIGQTIVEPGSISRDVINDEVNLTVNAGKPNLAQGLRNFGVKGNLGNIDRFQGIENAINKGGRVSDIFEEASKENSFREFELLVGGQGADKKTQDERTRAFFGFAGGAKASTKAQDKKIADDIAALNQLNPTLTNAQNETANRQKALGNSLIPLAQFDIQGLNKELLDGATGASDLFKKGIKDGIADATKDLTLKTIQAITAQVNISFDKFKINVNDVNGLAAAIKQGVKEGLEGKTGLPTPPQNTPAVA